MPRSLIPLSAAALCTAFAAVFATLAGRYVLAALLVLLLAGEVVWTLQTIRRNRR